MRYRELGKTGLKVSELGFVRDGLPVPEMVVPDHVKPLGSHVRREPVVAVDELDHAVGDLQHAPDFVLRDPFDGVDLGKAVL